MTIDSAFDGYQHAHEVLMNDLFPDGYCSCRCGPVHHVLCVETQNNKWVVYCRYHRRLCSQGAVQDLHEAIDAICTTGALRIRGWAKGARDGL